MLLSVIGIAIASAALSADCGSSWIGCTNTGSSVEVGGTITQPGTAPVGGDDGTGGGGGWIEGGGGEAAPPEPGDAGYDPADICSNILGCADTEAPPEEGEPEIPAVTMSDVVSFAPAPPGFLSEPDGVGVVGMPVNFVAAASAHTASGALFGFPVTVTFQPIDFVFEHGDGTSRTSPTGGATWTALGQAQFSPTATSHVYVDRGVYVTRAVARYGAAVDFGAGWIPVPGVLTLPSGATEIEVVEVRTALVERTCLEDPGGPACRG